MSVNRGAFPEAIKAEYGRKKCGKRAKQKVRWVKDISKRRKK